MTWTTFLKTVYLRRRFFYITLCILFAFILTETAVRALLFKYIGSDPYKINCSTSWRIHYFKPSPPATRPSTALSPPPIGIFDETKGWDARPNLSHYFPGGGGRIFISTNSKGLRGVKEYPYSKSRGEKRIALVGDSFTFGVEGDDNEIFSYFLDEMMPGIDVLNLGVGGYGHGQILLKLKEEALKYNPDAVVLFFVRQNMHRNILTFRDYAKPRYVLRDNKLMLTNVPVLTGEELKRREGFNIYVVDLFKILAYLRRERMGLVEKEEISLTRALIREMEESCKDIGARFILIGFMDEKSLIEGLAGKDSTLLFVDKSGIPETAFESHWKALGHKLVAKNILKGLLEYNLITPKDLVIR